MLQLIINQNILYGLSLVKLCTCFYKHYISTDSVVLLPVVCTILALEGMETNMMMIDMETEMMIGMAMGEIENGVLEMRIDMVGMENHMAVMVTDMVEIMSSDLAEMGTRMMTTKKEVKAMMIIIMGQEVEVLIKIEILQMKLMSNIHPGLSSLFFLIISKFLGPNFLGGQIGPFPCYEKSDFTNCDKFSPESNKNILPPFPKNKNSGTGTSFNAKMVK